MNSRETSAGDLPFQESKSPENNYSPQFKAGDLEGCVPPQLRELVQVPEAVRVVVEVDHINGVINMRILDPNTPQSHSDFNREFTLSKMWNLESDSVRTLLQASLRYLPDRVLYVDALEVAESLRGNGVGTTFYAQLERLAKEKGFRFLVGYQISLERVKYYLGLGRLPFGALKPEVQDWLTEVFQRANVDPHFGASMRSHPEVRIAYQVTIKFLYKEDLMAFADLDWIESNPLSRHKKTPEL